MTRDDIIRMARDDARWGDAAYAFANDLERFAAIVAAAEREVCAQAAWDFVQYEVHADLADQVAAVIRARSTP